MHNLDVIALIASKMNGYESFAEQIGRTRFMALCMDIGANPDEVREIEKIANSFRYSVETTGDGVELHRSYLQSPYNDIIENGMSAPLTGGEDGLVHMPDGTVHMSNVPVQLWGHELPEFAKVGTAAFEEMDVIQRSLFPQEVKDSVTIAKPDFVQYARDEITKAIREVGME